MTSKATFIKRESVTDDRGRAGTVLAVVPPMHNPFMVIAREVSRAVDVNIHTVIGEHIRLREEESYIVAFRFGKRVRVMWPIAARLRKAKMQDTEGG